MNVEIQTEDGRINLSDEAHDQITAVQTLINEAFEVDADPGIALEFILWQFTETFVNDPRMQSTILNIPTGDWLAERGIFADYDEDEER